jgi:hypothetical protein
MDLSCPHCGLQIALRGARHEYCPRCIADRGQPVPLIASSLFKHAGGEDTGDAGLDARAANAGPGLHPKHAF